MSQTLRVDLERITAFGSPSRSPNGKNALCPASLGVSPLSAEALDPSRSALRGAGLVCIVVTC
jgi:hypothetical protein